MVPGFAKELGAVAVVTDMSPLRNPMRWVREVAEGLTEEGDNMPLFQVLMKFKRSQRTLGTSSA